MYRLSRCAAAVAALIISLAIFSQALVGAPDVADVTLPDSGASDSAVISSDSNEIDNNAVFGESTTANSFSAEEETSSVGSSSQQNTVFSASPTASASQQPPAVASGSANKLMPIRTNNTVTASLADAQSSITYTFSVTERGYIVLSLSRSEGALAVNTGWIVSLYEEYYLNGRDGETSFRFLTRLKTDSTNAAVSSAEIGVLPGSFRAVVTSDEKYSASPFSLCVSFSASDSYEIECNDTASRYTNIYQDKTMYGSSSLRDEVDSDYYMFRVTAPGYVDVCFSHPDGSLTSVGWNISVTDVNGTEYYHQTSRMLDTTIESGALGLAPGIYFIKVVGHVYSPVRYSLLLSIMETDDFETELNDSVAANVSLNVPFRGATTERSGAIDKDYFTFSIPSDGYITVDFSHKAGIEVRNGWSIKLYDSKRTLLYTGTSDWSVDSTSSGRINLAKGSYYLCIDSENMYLNTAIYTAKINFTADANREKEPNNTFALANVLYRGKTIAGSLLAVGVDADTDIYKITSTGGEMSITFTHDRLPENREGWIIYLCDSNGTKIAPTDKNGNVFTNAFGSIIYGTSCSRSDAQTQAYYKNVPAGNYYITVETGLYFSSVEYSISYS